MSKPRSADDLAAYFGLTPEEFERQWNAGSRAADATWALGPHERKIGHTYTKLCVGSNKFGAPVYDYEEDWK